jgi:hypothetical protein
MIPGNSTEVPRQVPATLDGQPVMVSADRLGVSLLPAGVAPVITRLADSYDFSGRTKTLFDTDVMAPIKPLVDRELPSPVDRKAGRSR